ncbi:MAG: sulfite oxidase heme-binding subunit YedZ [Acetobacteraceae bacterium]
MSRSRKNILPWRDRSGRLSALKIAVLALLPLPALLALFQWATGTLTGHPDQAVLLLSGFWSDRLLVLTLAVTPLAALFALPRLILVRRMLGLGAGAYALAHLGVYVLQQGFAWRFIGVQMVSHPVLTIGTVSILAMAALAVTSTDGWVRRLGRSWKQLHLLVHPAIVLALLHTFMEAPTAVSRAAVFSGFYLWLLGWRLMPREWRRRPAPLLGLAIVAAVLTSGVEAGWYAVATGLPAGRVFAANFSLIAGLRPAHWVGLGCLALALLVTLRRMMTRTPLSAMSIGRPERVTGERNPPPGPGGARQPAPR